MVKKSRENLTGNLFNPGEKLALGEEFDAEGNVYQVEGRVGLVREAPSPEWVEAQNIVRKTRPDIAEKDPLFRALARIHLRDIKKANKKNKKESK